MINTKLVSSGVAFLLMAVPLTAPPSPKPAAPKPINLDQNDIKLAFVREQKKADDLIEKQFPHTALAPPPPPALSKPISPYAVRVAPVVYRPYNVKAVALVYPGAVRNHFTYGYCTYYVATRRYIPWFGDAGQWAWNAVAYGFRTGYRPVVGAVWQIGNHVAYVEAVFANGSFRISEMNWYQNGGGFGRVDYRTLPPGSGGVFIY